MNWRFELIGNNVCGIREILLIVRVNECEKEIIWSSFWNLYGICV